MDFPNLLMAFPLFDRLRGLRLERITWNGPVAVLVFHSHRDRENLVIHLHQEVQSFHLDTTLQAEFEHIQFQDGRHDFSFLGPHLEGATFLGAAPLVGQSLERLDFTSSGNFKEDIPLSLFIEFFGGGRLVLTDRDNRVIRASRKGGPHHRPGAHYWPGSADLAEFGQELPLAPEAFGEWPEPLLDRVRTGGDAVLPEALVKGVRGFSPLSVRYLVERSRAHPRYDPREVLARRLGRWVRLVQQEREQIFVLSFPPELRRPCLVLPFALKGESFLALQAVAMSVARLDDYVSALNFQGRSCLARQQMSELMDSVRRALEQRLQRKRRLAGKLEADWERAAAAGELRRMADSLASHLHVVKKGMSVIELEDVHGSGRTLSVPLDPARSPQENLNRLYKQAAKGERGLQTIEMRLEEVRNGILEDEEILSERLPALASCHCNELGEIDELRQALLELGRETSLLDTRRHARARSAEGPQLFRRYELPGGWLVLVGRNNRENDLLTHREAAPGDLWFHAAGVSGSHVILRTGQHKSGPPRSILEAAAAIAAFHSKARNSELAPVIYTEKRYVRKPRKGAPGLALCTREKTLFVKPEAVGVLPV